MKKIDVLFSGLVCAWRFCDLSPCQNNGECKNLNQSYSCSCDEGFAGKNCQVNLTHCASVSCSRRGQCRLDEDDNISCKCDENWRGKISELQDEVERNKNEAVQIASGQISYTSQFQIFVLWMISILTVMNWKILIWCATQAQRKGYATWSP